MDESLEKETFKPSLNDSFLDSSISRSSDTSPRSFIERTPEHSRLPKSAVVQGSLPNNEGSDTVESSQGQENGSHVVWWTPTESVDVSSSNEAVHLQQRLRHLSSELVTLRSRLHVNGSDGGQPQGVGQGKEGSAGQVDHEDSNNNNNDPSPQNNSNNTSNNSSTGATYQNQSSIFTSSSAGSKGPGVPQGLAHRQPSNIPRPSSVAGPGPPYEEPDDDLPADIVDAAAHRSATSHHQSMSFAVPSPLSAFAPPGDGNPHGGGGPPSGSFHSHQASTSVRAIPASSSLPSSLPPSHPPPPIPNNPPPSLLRNTLPRHQAPPPASSKRKPHPHDTPSADASAPAVVGDLIHLPSPVAEEGVLRTLQERFSMGKYFTNVGPILLAVNPYHHVGLPLTLNAIKTSPSSSGDLFRVVKEAARLQSETGYPQAIILSGVSGSGKTYASMQLLRHLFDVAGGGPETDAFKHLAAAFTVLRSLGSAKTQSNSESSRIVSNSLNGI
ncbi:unnamed protein product [Cyprideis torosa]|uniref:Uncharacterized protein n=1 Tax=Cyprideis torosa TaxID=163714 RepID=A0A7R8WDA0_9CRUS|nr:unnamed protein product [Cyprideis torosa]CAG0888358.1 unnamed protein product [Cyprideis torosa]